MLMQHGGQKLFGFPATPGQPFAGAPELLSRVWIAGVMEVVGGLLLVLGLLTRAVGFLLAGELAVAYFLVHAPRGFFPILNRGELAALYSFVFLYFAAAGGGRYSLDHLLFRRRR
jgi:putative oxidoreductase